MNELEVQAVHEFRNKRQKLNVKLIGNIDHATKEMEEVFHNDFSKSGRVQIKEVNAWEAQANKELEKTTPRS